MRNERKKRDNNTDSTHNTHSDHPAKLGPEKPLHNDKRKHDI